MSVGWAARGELRTSLATSLPLCPCSRRNARTKEVIKGDQPEAPASSSALRRPASRSEPGSANKRVFPDSPQRSIVSPRDGMLQDPTASDVGMSKEDNTDGYAQSTRFPQDHRDDFSWHFSSELRLAYARAGRAGHRHQGARSSSNEHPRAGEQVQGSAHAGRIGQIGHASPGGGPVATQSLGGRPRGRDRAVWWHLASDLPKTTAWAGGS